MLYRNLGRRFPVPRGLWVVYALRVIYVLWVIEKALSNSLYAVVVGRRAVVVFIRGLLVFCE